MVREDITQRCLANFICPLSLFEFILAGRSFEMFDGYIAGGTQIIPWL